LENLDFANLYSPRNQVKIIQGPELAGENQLNCIKGGRDDHPAALRTVTLLSPKG
jgi:hypothetical protein